jgi:hypothetical protein
MAIAALRSSLAALQRLLPVAGGQRTHAYRYQAIARRSSQFWLEWRL